MKRLALASCVLLGCAAADKALIYTENGIVAGEKAWDTAYRAQADDCESKFEPATPAMEDCFGDFFDANAKVATAVKAAVAVLRTYWTARAAGETPDWPTVVKEVGKIIEDLPPEAAEYFKKVKGI